MQDLYQRSPEERRGTLEFQLQRTYPNLIFADLVLPDEPTHYVIEDVSPHFPHLPITESARSLEISTDGRLRMLSLPPLCDSLGMAALPLLKQTDPNKTLLVFPGEGAETVRAVLETQGLIDSFRSIVIGANRIRNIETGFTEAIRLSNVQKGFKDRIPEKIERVIVFDDVIDSGATIKVVKRELDYRNATWFAATPIMVSPLFYEGREHFPSSVEGYEKIFASLIIGGENTPQINSLSSFLEPGAKAERLIDQALAYTSSVDDRTHLLEVLSHLRQIVSYS